MSNIATGIGLSGQLKVDNSGQLNRLAAEQAAAQQRQKEAAAKKKADDALLKDIASNTIFSKTMIQPRNQADAEARLTQGLADIVKSIGEGDESGNATVNAHTKLNKLSQEINTLAQLDKQQTEIWKKAFENPEQYRDYFRPVDINGKTYNNAWEAYNAGEDLDAIANGWGGTEHVVMDNEVLGGKAYIPNPQRTVSAFESVLPKIEDEMYSVLNKGQQITGPGDETYIDMFKTIGPNSVESLVDMALGDAAVIHNYETEMKKEGTFTGKRDAAFFAEVGRRVRDDLNRDVQTLRRDAGMKPFTPTKEKAAPSTGARFSNNKIAVFDGEDLIRDVKQPWSDNSETGKNYNYLAVAAIEPKTGDVKSNIDIGAGTLIWDSKKNVLREPKDFEKNAPATPHELVVLSDGKTKKPYIRYLSALSAEEGAESLAFGTEDPNSGDKYKGRTQESFYIPATEANLKRLAESTETGIDEWNSLKIELQKRATKGGSTSTSDAGTGGDVMGGDSKEYTSRQTAALAAFEKQLGRSPNQSELNKILEKYK